MEHEDELKNMLYNSLSFYLGLEDYICPKESCLEIQNHVRYIVHSYLFDRIYDVSNDVLMKISCEIDSIINENNLINKKFDIKKIVNNVTNGIMKIIENCNRFGKFVNEQEYPILFKLLLDKINSIDDFTSLIELKDQFMKIILNNIQPIEQTIENKISNDIDEIMKQYHQLTWSIFKFTIAHDVHYYVNKALEENKN